MGAGSRDTLDLSESSVTSRALKIRSVSVRCFSNVTSTVATTNRTISPGTVIRPCSAATPTPPPPEAESRPPGPGSPPEAEKRKRVGEEAVIWGEIKPLNPEKLSCDHHYGSKSSLTPEAMSSSDHLKLGGRGGWQGRFSFTSDLGAWTVQSGDCPLE